MNVKSLRPRVGILALTLEFYERLDPELRPKRENWLQTKVIPALAAVADVRFSRAAFRREDVDAIVAGFDAEGCDAIVVVCLTYSPSQISLPALQRTRLPIVVWNVQELLAVDDAYDGNLMGHNHGVHGTQDLANVLLRGNVPFHYVTSHLTDADALVELDCFFSAASAVAGLRRCRLGLMGHPFPGMGDFAVDTTHLAATLGCSCESLSIDEYHQLAAAAPDSTVKELVAEYRKSYAVAVDVTESDLDLTARAEIALRSMVADRRLDAMSFQFLAFGEDQRTETLPFVAVSRMMGDGMGFAGEGDLVGAAGTWFLNRLCPPAGFSEIFTIDYANNGLLLSHMGEANTALARRDRKMPLVARPVPIIRTRGRQLALVNCFEPGPATLCALALGPNHRWRFLASAVDIQDFGPLAKLPTPHCKITPRDDVRRWLTRYALAGGPHHNAICFGDARPRIEIAASLLDADYCEVQTMYLGLDLGTTNVKAVVVDHGGRVASVGSAPVKRYHTDDGGIEQDIGQIWQAVQLAIHDAIRQVDSASILAVGVSSQGGAMQILDPGDKPRGRVISWLDARGQSFDAALMDELGSEYFSQRIGHGASGIAIGQILRLQAETPASLQHPAHIGFVGDIIVGRLCGRRAHDPTSLSIAMLYNPWLKRPDPEVMARLGLEDEQLPCMLPATTAAGTIDEAAASAIGLPAGIPVSPAVHDQYTASLGAGSVSKGDVSFGAGTAWVLLANAGQLSPPATPNAFVCSHPVNGLYGQMLSMVNGGSAIQWAMNMIGNRHADVQQVDRLLAAAPPGAEGLRFWPFLSIGPEVNGRGRLKGRLSDITLAHGPAHLIRAVVEGLACELNRHVRQLAGDCSSINIEQNSLRSIPSERNELRTTFIRIKRLIMCGPAATGGNTPQIIADVTRLPVHCVETPDISALGAAMMGRSLVEPGVNLDEIARQWTPPRRTVTPSEQAAVYEDLYGEYLSIFTESSNRDP